MLTKMFTLTEGNVVKTYIFDKQAERIVCIIHVDVRRHMYHVWFPETASHEVKAEVQQYLNKVPRALQVMSVQEFISYWQLPATYTVTAGNNSAMFEDAAKAIAYAERHNASLTEVRLKNVEN